MKKRILIAPLNWGLGHATRCIPIINQLILHNYTPVIASDGIALALLKKEFPTVETIELPAYDVTYAKKGHFFKLKLLKDSPKLLKAIKAEKKATKHLVENYNIDGIISDNRLGVHSKNIPSVFITHQLQVLSGNTTWLSTKMHQRVIEKFNECWVPDHENEPSLSGKLGHMKGIEIPIKYLGPLSRFKRTQIEPLYDLMILLSGPEPQRTLLENQLLDAYKQSTKRILCVRGVIEETQSKITIGNITVYNFMAGQQLEDAINSSSMMLCRSGYTTVMDLSVLGKKAFFIPTPGQFEQEYLAKRLDELNLVPYCKQDDFSIDKLDHIQEYKGLDGLNTNANFKDLFKLF
ncbi:glycosyltransferase 28 domain-containing protein [Formosa agariphila KMM 3901]|uniref:Glycosyltransferase 28 domain-containing protein n=1 Tax=Formosa agariphila (strain DSM 15362 / KCTC 12365 / LMG 23005 / KMM 3901 / M-2Alg 35-1) TaxID=1347342 RepID=T2KQW1_FORAG|nr:glycosyltransferase [Formosa agariphila]CDF80898.1 glycosyltransferase 28 domain-containing protein [Formosa agariphila KMM 3901]